MVKGQLDIQINKQFRRKLKGLIYNDKLQINSCVNIDGTTYKVIEVKELEFKYYQKTGVLRIENEFDFIMTDNELKIFANNVGYLNKADLVKNIMTRFEIIGSVCIKRVNLICFRKFNRFFKFDDVI